MSCNTEVTVAISLNCQQTHHLLFCRLSFEELGYTEHLSPLYSWDNMKSALEASPDVSPVGCQACQAFIVMVTAKNCMQSRLWNCNMLEKKPLKSFLWTFTSIHPFQPPPPPVIDFAPLYIHTTGRLCLSHFHYCCRGSCVNKTSYGVVTSCLHSLLESAIPSSHLFQTPSQGDGLTHLQVSWWGVNSSHCERPCPTLNHWSSLCHHHYFN